MPVQAGAEPADVDLGFCQSHCAEMQSCLVHLRRPRASELQALLNNAHEDAQHHIKQCPATLHVVAQPLSETVSELTTAGLDYYFVRVLKESKVGFVTQQSANLGVLGVRQVMAPVIRNVISRLGHTQIQAIAQSIRQLME